ncbi:MAG: DUF1761 domain-containing protein [bacterium]
MPTVHINFLAVLVAALVAFLLGGLWYSPILFAKLWVEAHGYTEEKVNEMRKTASRAYLVSVVCHLGIALAIAVLVHYTGLVNPLQGLKLGLLLWLGFAFTLGLMGNMFSEKRISTFFIDTGYQLTYLVIMSVILAVWH